MPSLYKVLKFNCELLLRTLIACNLLFAASTGSYAETAEADELDFTVVITQPYLDIRTGPGKAYPVFYVAQRHETIAITKRRTKWYKVHLGTTGDRTVTGWVHQQDLQGTEVYLLNTPAEEHPFLRSDFNPAFTVTYSVGNINSADLISLSLAYSRLEVLSFEARVSSFIGVNQQGWLSSGHMVYSPFPKWIVSPYLMSGYGYIRRESRGTLIEQEDQSDHYFQAGSGINIRISDQYRLRLEYVQLNTLTSTDDNKELDTWSIGLSAKF